MLIGFFYGFVTCLMEFRLMMKTKLVEFVQHLYHEMGDEDKAEEYLENALPCIGLVVMYFNSLESALDSALCENFTDRSDSTGLIVLNQMNFSAKVELLRRFCDDLQVGMNLELPGYNQIINNLKESARLRNLVVHANWESTDEEGYTYVRLKMSRKGMQQEYVQFTEESLHKIIELIVNTTSELHEFWEHRSEVLCGAS